jgi:Sulfotransferase family
MDRLFKLGIKGSRPFVKDAIKHVWDRGFYFLKPKKTIVLMFSSMRAGSTLLKALLAEAPDVSHLSERDYRDHFYDGNKYSFYRRIYNQAEQRIILLKKPHWFGDADEVRKVPDLDSVKIVVLVRDVLDVVRSIERMPEPFKNHESDRSFFVNYWYDAYRTILDSVSIVPQDFRVVRYEDLLQKPIEITQQLFQFLGSAQRAGVRSYRKPKDFDWTWGQDDGGEKLATAMEVSPTEDKDVDQELWGYVRSSQRVRDIRRIFGYEDEFSEGTNYGWLNEKLLR